MATVWWRWFARRDISPVENIAVSIASLGEGYHNYHHVFPWDYKTGELGNYPFNITTGFIDAFARIGWAYDRKYVSPEMIHRRAHRSGDGSHIWGYGDIDISKDDLTELDMMNNHELWDWERITILSDGPEIRRATFVLVIIRGPSQVFSKKTRTEVKLIRRLSVIFSSTPRVLYRWKIFIL